jgi:uncharacterized caspase-like protein
MEHFVSTGVGRLFYAFFAGRRLTVCALHAAMLAVALLALLVAHPARTLADDKIALVVGNSLYRNVPALTNPVNDAADVAESLRRLGFSVQHVADLDYDGFRRALIDFGQAAKTADKAVIFYAGHGVEIDGKNWLIPVDAEIKSEIDVYAEAINLETLIDLSVLPKVIGLVVLDACRNNPFASVSAGGRALSTPNTPPPTGGAEKKPNPPLPAAAKDATLPGTPAGGLAPVDVTDNVLVAFSAAAGTTASDGDGRNSPYSGALLRYVEKPGLEINYLFRDVHDDVLKATRNNQEPAVYGTLSKDEIYLKEGDARVAAVDQEAAAEKLAWAFVRATNDIAVLRRFSAQFPSSLHKADITARLAQLEAAEKFAWDMVAHQHSASAYRAFLDIYPFGDHADEARVTLASLGSNPDDGQTFNLPKPPEATYALASAAPDAVDKPDEDSESIEKAWAVLKDSRDQDVTGRFAKKFPSLRHHRLPPGSDFGLRPVNSTEWMLTTADDAEVNRCFKGDAEACLSAVDKYPDYVQLRFQLCRATRHLKPLQDAPDRVRANSTDSCMLDAVEDARARGYLVSAFTRSEAEELRNQEYRVAVSHVQQNVGNIVGNTVSNVVSNVVGNAAGIAAAAAAANAAGAAGTGAAFPAPVLLAVPLVRWNAQLNSVKAVLGSGGGSTPKATLIAPAITPTNATKVVVPGANAAGTAATNAATNAASKASSSAATNAAKAVTNAATNAAAKAATSAASNAASKAASSAASNAASKAASNAASNAAGKAASNAASRAAGNAASNAASKAASNAASKAAGNAASNAASKINIPSDIRLKEDIVLLGRTHDGLQIYRYRYIGDDTFYVGVMAQEVAERAPDAVTRSEDGYLTVDYARLGLIFMTFEEWSRQNGSAANN